MKRLEKFMSCGSAAERVRLRKRTGIRFRSSSRASNQSTEDACPRVCARDRDVTGHPPMPTPLDHQLESQQSLAESRVREATRLAPRERAVELVFGGAFLAAAAALLLTGVDGKSFDPGAAAITIFTLAVVSRVEFDAGAAYTRPLQLVLVPMLFLLPAATVPLCVAVALTLAKLPEALVRKRPLGRALMSVGDSWFALG